MADIIADTLHNSAQRGRMRRFVVKDEANIKAGALVGLDADGYLDSWADVAGMKFLGVLQVEVTGDTEEEIPVEGMVDVSGIVLRNVAIAGTFVQADLNALIYCPSNNPADAAKAASTNVEAIGWASRFREAGIGDITLFTPEEHLALNA